MNADFFDGAGKPINIQIEQGQIVRREHGTFPSIGFDEEHNFFMGKPIVSGKVLKSGEASNINAFNVVRGAESVVFYNSFYGTATGAGNDGTELLIRNITPWFVNDSVLCIIDSIAINDGNMTIAPGKSVISAQGSRAGFFNGLMKGDTIAIAVNASTGLYKMKESLGGHPIIIKNGTYAVMDSSDPFVTARHPRTGIGVNADSTVLYLVTVDGRQTSSKGMNLFEFASFMLSIGVYQGMNFDGGGSTTMVARNQVMNSPSDATGERAVANCFLIISTAPAGPINKLELFPRDGRLYINNQQQFTVSAYDEYYNPIPLSPGQVQYHLNPPSLGNVNSSGLFTAGVQADTGYLIASYNTIKDSVRIIVKSAAYINLSPSVAVTDNYFLIKFKARVFDIDSLEQTIPPQSLIWRCTDTAVGYIDAVGQFKGKKEGSAQIIVTYGSISDTSQVYVEIGKGVVFLDSLESGTDWWFSGENIDSLNCSLVFDPLFPSFGQGALKINYSFTYQSGSYNWLYLKKSSMNLYGVPDSVLLDVRSDGQPHRIFYDFLDANNLTVRATGHKVANKPLQYETIRAPLPKSTQVFYPFRFKSISIALGSGQVPGQQYTGSFHIDGFRVKYPTPITTLENNFTELNNREFYLYPNYPNPFNPFTRIRFCVPQLTDPASRVTVRVFDLLGNRITELLNEARPAGEHSIEFNGAGLPSGVYFCELRAGEYYAINKMLLLK